MARNLISVVILLAPVKGSGIVTGLVFALFFLSIFLLFYLYVRSFHVTGKSRQVRKVDGIVIVTSASIVFWVVIVILFFAATGCSQRYVPTYYEKQQKKISDKIYHFKEWPIENKQITYADSLHCVRVPRED